MAIVGGCYLPFSEKPNWDLHTQLMASQISIYCCYSVKKSQKVTRVFVNVPHFFRIFATIYSHLFGWFKIWLSLTPWFQKCSFSQHHWGPTGPIRVPYRSTLEASLDQPRHVRLGQRGAAAEDSLQWSLGASGRVSRCATRPCEFSCLLYFVDMFVYLFTYLFILYNCIYIYILYNKHNIHGSLCVWFIVSIHGVICFCS